MGILRLRLLNCFSFVNLFSVDNVDVECLFFLRDGFNCSFVVVFFFIYTLEDLLM